MRMSQRQVGVRPCDGPPASPAAPGARMEFNLICRASRVYLFIAHVDGGVRGWVPMLRCDADRWQRVLELPPGTYRYRYYADHGGVITYASPRDTGEGAPPMDGLDAMLTVPPVHTGGVVWPQSRRTIAVAPARGRCIAASRPGGRETGWTRRLP